MITVKVTMDSDRSGPNGKPFRYIELSDFDSFEDFLEAWRKDAPVSGVWLFVRWAPEPHPRNTRIITGRREINFRAGDARTVERCDVAFIEDEAA